MNFKKILCLLCAFVICLSLCGCGSKAALGGYGGTDGYNFSMSTADTAVPESVGGTGYENGTDYEDGNLIIYTANVNAETTDFDAASAALLKLISDFGGTVSNSQINGDADYSSSGKATVTNRSAWYEIDIPADSLDNFLSSCGNIGNITGQSKSGSNITQVYSDNEARLTSLRTEQGRLLKLIESADNVSDLIALEDRLSNISSEIESLESAKRKYDKQLAFSSVTVNLREVTIYTNTGGRSIGQQFADALKGGFISFGHGIIFILTQTVYILPYIITAAVVVFIIIVIRKRNKKKRAAQNVKQEQ